MESTRSPQLDPTLHPGAKCLHLLFPKCVKKRPRHLHGVGFRIQGPGLREETAGEVMTGLLRGPRAMNTRMKIKQRIKPLHPKYPARNL